MFKVLQAQLNRYAIAGSKSKQGNPGLWASMILSVDGKLGATTVNTYKLVAGGLAQGGATPPVPERAASKETLAQSAESVALFLAMIADRAGLPPADVSFPNMPSANSSGGFGPSTSPQTITLTPDQARKLLEAARGTGLNPSGLPGFEEGGIPASELVSQTNPLSPNGSTPFYKNKFIIGGAILGVGLAAFLATRKS
jgi:hypothetical protein